VRHLKVVWSVLVPLVVLAVPMVGQAGLMEVNTFDASFVGPQRWFESDMRGAGTASIVDLTGQGGNLENNAPLPPGAAMLTTGNDVNDKAEVAVTDTWGTSASLFPSLEVSYSYYKSSVGDGNPFAAPSIKLSFLGAAPISGDGFVTLVYEPTWNQAGSEGSSTAVPTDDWQSVSIDGDTGLFWGTGGFSQPNTAGGPPLRTLNEWLAAFDADFLSAELVAVSVGVGTYNLSQTGYFDDVTIASDAGSMTYDFEAAPAVPEPSTFVLLGIGGVALCGFAVRRKKLQAAK